MKNKTFLILLSLLLALMASGAALFWLRSQGGISPKPVLETVVWTASEDIPAGARITEKMLEKSTVPEDQLQPGIYTNPEDIIGKYAKNAILKGENFPAQRLYGADENILSMRLQPGYRAFSVAVTRFSGVADLLKAGDRVDVFVFLKEIVGEEALVRSDVAQIMLQNVEVLAVRRETETDSERAEEIPDLYAVTLAVPVKAVEKLILAEETGLVKLALRPMEDNGTVTSYGVIWKELLLDPSMKLRDFDPDYGTVEDQETLTKAAPVPTGKEPQDSAGVGEDSDPGAGAAEVPTSKDKPAAPASPSFTWYTVKAGDTLMSISRLYFNGSAAYYDDIMRYNGLKDSAIRPGQKLKIPTAGR